MNLLPFYLGQIGLLLAAIFSIGIIHVTSQLSTRPPWYYYVSVWLVACCCAFVFSEPYVTIRESRLSYAGYALRVLFGMERAAVFYFYTRHMSASAQLPIRVITNVNRYVGGVAVSAMVIAFVWAQYQTIQAQKGETNALRKEIGAVKADTTRDVALKKAVDSIEATVLARTAQINVLLTEFRAARKENRDLIAYQQTVIKNQQIILSYLSAFRLLGRPVSPISRISEPGAFHSLEVHPFNPEPISKKRRGRKNRSLPFSDSLDIARKGERPD